MVIQKLTLGIRTTVFTEVKSMTAGTACEHVLYAL